MKMLFKGNSSRLELLIEKIQSTRDTSDSKDQAASLPGSSKDRDSSESQAGPSRVQTPTDFTETTSPLLSDPEGSLEDQLDELDDDEDEDFACGVCGERFGKGRDLIEHEQIHSDNLQFTCLYCPRLFKHKRSRDRHIKLHTGDKKYKCLHCDSAFSRSDHLKIHMRTHDNRKPYKCGLCSRGYNTATALASHQQNHLRKDGTGSGGSCTPSEDSPSPGVLRCHLCSVSCSSYDQLQNHIIVGHSDTNSPVESLSDQNHSDTNHTTICDEPKAICAYCLKDFPNLEQMYEHVNESHKDLIPNNNLPAKKEVLERELDTKDQLFANEPWRTAVTYSTSDSAHLVTDLSKKKKTEDIVEVRQLKKRKSISYESNDKPFICSCCYVQLPNFRSFLLHMESHMAATSNLFVGFCVFCGETNRDPISFTNHMFGHAIMQLPEHFCCCLCEKSFDHCDKLQRHLVDDHVLTVYKCAICKETFDTKLLLKLHFTNKHTNECQHYKCHLCSSSQMFHDKLSAEIHISMKHYHQFASCIGGGTGGHSEEGVIDPKSYAVFNCGFCQKTFNDQYSHYLHLIKDHNHLPPGKGPSASPKASYQSQDLLPTQESSHFEKIPLNKSKSSLSLQCAYCFEFCKSKSDLQNHIKSHHINCSKAKHKCNICDEIFTSAISLADHKLIHCKIIDGNSCIQCKSILSDEQTFYSHQLKHTNGLVKANSQILLPAICIICSQTLQTDVEIKLHAKFHLKHLLQREFFCTSCNVKTSDSTLCKDCLEKSITTTPSPLEDPSYFTLIKREPSEDLSTNPDTECHLCKQYFSSLTKLQVHLIEHNFYGMNQYSCYVCSSVFTAASGLQSHMLQHNLEAKPYECSTCHSSFFFRAELDNHHFLHLTKPFAFASPDYKTCQFCGNVFVNKAALNEHQCPVKVAPKVEPDQKDEELVEEIQ